MSTQVITIKNLSEDDRPREKLIKKGIQSLSNAELLAIIIRLGAKGENAIELSQRILAQTNNNLSELGRYTLRDFKKIKGVGTAKAAGIIAALELGRRRNSSDIIEKKKVASSQDIFTLFHPILSDLPHEEFWVLFLNRHHKIIDMQRISAGGLSETVVDVRLIMKMGIERLASSIALCHNHPSGNSQPSGQDKAITHKVKEGGTLLDIALLDHVIIADNSYYSFSDEEQL